MRIAVGADHAGFPLKGHVIDLLTSDGHSVIDLGTTSTDPVDYPDYAKAVGEAVTSGNADAGILLCGSGVGASIAANKIRGVRAALCHDAFSAKQAREDDDANVLCLGPRVIGPSLAAVLVKLFLSSQFSGVERHARRLQKVLELEKGLTASGK